MNRKFSKMLLFAYATMACIFPAAAQTNPIAVSLPFSWNSQSSAALPAGVAVHRFSSIPTTRTASPATGDLPVQGSSATNNAGGWYYLGTDGVGLLASGSNPAGALVVAVNTTGLSNINVSWNCKTIYNQASRDNSIALQYRIGNTGSFINLGSSSTYSSTGNGNGHTSAAFLETLPAGAENQALVQLRWIYWESAGSSGSRDKISIDNIAVNSVATTCNAPGTITGNNVSDSSATIYWTSSSSAISYEYALTASPAPPASGTVTTDTAYAASGLSAGLTYYMHVRSNCGNGNLSGWTTNSFATTADSGFTVMTYNLLNYPGSTAALREPAYRTIINNAQPDILIVQELSSPSGLGGFLNNVLNYSAGTYSAGTLMDGPDSDNGIYYKTALFQFISNTPIHTSLRDINQFMLRHIASGDTLIIFSAHLKASNTPADALQRENEIVSLRNVTDALGAGKYFLVCGDFNIYGASEGAYQRLVQNGSNSNGKFNDVLSMSGTWNNPTYAPYHTQSPRMVSFGGGATGGMDDRFDMLLFSDAIVQSGGFDIVDNSYKAFGNDGQHYNQALNTPPYAVYDSALAAALHDASDHIPVVVKLKYTTPEAMVFRPGQNIRGVISAAYGTAGEFITVFPNPAHSTLFLKVNQNYTAPILFYLYDASGRVVNSVTMNSGMAGTVFSLDISAMPAGLYYLKSPALSNVCKIVKQ
jgi:endonuclease/exonuclease/phosphatase family metal-dependent hydrolase